MKLTNHRSAGYAGLLRRVQSQTAPHFRCPTELIGYIGEHLVFGVFYAGIISCSRRPKTGRITRTPNQGDESRLLMLSTYSKQQFRTLAVYFKHSRQSGSPLTCNLFRE